ncbi:MAG: hypothetical protein LUD15_07255 [Bacteroides sp.]|nr:hypothetical protein [Bacteroides sp.]
MQREDMRLIMEKYVNEMEDDTPLAAQLRNVLETDQPLRTFVHILQGVEKDGIWNVFKNRRSLTM